MQNYFIPKQNIIDETEVKGSKFITYIWRAKTPADATSFIAELKVEHFKASHVCSAFVAGDPGDSRVLGFSDDGEPSGTAGKPMLAVLQGSEIGQIAAAVVRYFGGTKLGTGGLVRAYAGAVKSALEVLPKIYKQQMTQLKLVYPYNKKAIIDNFLSNVEFINLATDYAADISQIIVLPTKISESISKEIFDLLNAQIQIENLGDYDFDKLIQPE